MWTFPIIEKLGGQSAVFERLKARGFPIETKDAVRMWRRTDRGVIPGNAVVELMRFCDEDGIKYSTSDFELISRDSFEDEAV